MDFRMNGNRYSLTRQDVEGRLASVEPDVIRELAVSINGRWYPPKQALATPLSLKNSDVNSRYAMNVMGRLGFELHDREDGELSGPPSAAGATEPRATRDPQALVLAVELLKGSGSALEDVLRTADAFDDWLGR
jgi:hypothetical protein